MAISGDKSNTEKIALCMLTESTTANIGLAKKRVSCFYDTFVVKQTVVLLMNFSANNPLLRQAANRWW